MHNPISKLASWMIRRSEARIGVKFDYIHHMADTDVGLLMRYNKVFSVVDPRKHLPLDAYHLARIRGALAADCGTCVEVEINLAEQAGLSSDFIVAALKGASEGKEPQAVIALTDATVRDRSDAPEARNTIRSIYGEKALIELSIVMNCAALLPGVKRAMGFATSCDLSIMQRRYG